MALIDDAMDRHRNCCQPHGSAAKFFPHRRRRLRIFLLLLVAAAIAALCHWKNISPSSIRSRYAKFSSRGQIEGHFAPRVDGCVDEFLIRGVQIGTYETKALIDGKLVRQGEYIKCANGEVLFRGVAGRDLIFEGADGQIFRRQFMPEADGSN
jgi:hypothetical protein